MNKAFNKKNGTTRDQRIILVWGWIYWKHNNKFEPTAAHMIILYVSDTWTITIKGQYVMLDAFKTIAMVFQKGGK